VRTDSHEQRALEIEMRPAASASFDVCRDARVERVRQFTIQLSPEVPDGKPALLSIGHGRSVAMWR
jgi:hypothetical protein